MKRCAIMQPTYMPWAGYLSLMDQVDLFIYLDDAQYERGTWHHRNRVLVAGQTTWLTVPVLRGHLGAGLHEVRPDDRQPWRRKQTALLQQAYARCDFAADLAELAGFLNQADANSLAHLNIALLGRLRERLGITTPALSSSTLSIGGTRTDRLIAILDHVGATDYLAAPGSLDYLREDDFSGRARQRLRIHEFHPAPYSQYGTAAFTSHLSILDVIAHLGWQGAARYIRGVDNQGLTPATSP
jgi:WbqC-like protein family